MRRQLLLVLMTSCLAASIASANMVCVSVEAELEAVDDPFDLLDGALRPGQVIHGLYTFESVTPDDHDLTTVGDYWHDLDPYGIELEIGPYLFRTDPVNVEFLLEMRNNHGVPPRDSYLLHSYNNFPLSNGMNVDVISWQLEDPRAEALDGDELPSGAPDLREWESNRLTVTGHDPANPSHRFSLRGRADHAALETCPPYPICISVRAQVAWVDDLEGLLEGRITAGDWIKATYRYDAATQDGNPFKWAGEYWHDAAPYGVWVEAGTFVFRTDPTHVGFLVGVLNDHSNRDRYVIGSYYNLPLDNGVPVDFIHWQLDDETETALSTEGLPLVPPELSDWDSVFGFEVMGSIPPAGDPNYRVRSHAVEVSLCGPAAIEESGSIVDEANRMRLNSWPNPFDEAVRIEYVQAAPGPAKIEIFDASGRRIRSLMDGWQDAGTVRVTWDGRNERRRRVAGGVYFFRVTTEGQSDGSRMVLIDP